VLSEDFSDTHPTNPAAFAQNVAAACAVVWRGFGWGAGCFYCLEWGYVFGHGVPFCFCGGLVDAEVAQQFADNVQQRGRPVDKFRYLFKDVHMCSPSVSFFNAKKPEILR